METPAQPTPSPAASDGAAPAPLPVPAPAPVPAAASGSRMPWGALIALIWVVPLAIFALRLFTPGSGWETLFLLLYTPIWYPILGVLGMVPRWVWRKRAGKEADPPHRVIQGFCLHWSGLFLMAIAVRGTGDSGGVDSVLGRVLPFFEERGETAVAGIGLICAIMGLLAAMTVAANLEPAAAPAGKRSALRTYGIWLVIPAALALGFAGQLISMSGS